MVNTVDGTVWTRREGTRGGEALYAPEKCGVCPSLLMATLTELAVQGIAGSADVLPVPAGPEPQALSVERLAEIRDRAVYLHANGVDADEYELELSASVDVPALLDEVARLTSWVAELLAERHVTNEALDDVVRELRTSYAERARRETHPGRRQAWRMLAQCEESERVANALLTPEAERSADKLTQLLAPTQALREVPDGEHYATVHRGYTKGRDLPETGGAQ